MDGRTDIDRERARYETRLYVLTSALEQVRLLAEDDVILDIAERALLKDRTRMRMAS